MRYSFARIVCASALALAVSSCWAQTAPADAIVRFDIARFSVSGNTLLPQSAVDAVLAPFLGRQRDFGDVQRALEALEAAYHERGYNVVQVELPEQELNGGVVQLKVVQIKVGRVTVSGNTVFDEANVRRSLPQLREGQTPNLKQVSAGLKLANENPSKKVAMKLQSGELDDEVDVKLEVSDQKTWSGTLNLDNTGSAATGKTHAGVVLQNANLFGRDHVASVQYTTTVEKPSQVSVWGAGYHIPLYELGDSLDLFASYSDVDSGAVAAGLVNLAVSGKGAVYGARYNQAMARREGYESRLVYGLDYKAYKNSVLLAGTDFGNDVTVHPAGITYLGAWTLPKGEANLSLGYLRNIPGGKLGGSADIDKARSGAKAAYQIVRVAAAYSRALGGDWQGRFIFNGQYTPDALIAGEQFGAGGASSVRGFDEREVSNDNGFGLNLELYTPNLWTGHENGQCRMLGFVDAAHASRNHALPGELESTTIASTGLGLRFMLAPTLNVQVDLGHVLRAGATPGTDKNKLHVRIGAAY
jgi:hemolysin activation/secretion protein